MREFTINTYKGMQADYTRKLQGISGVVSALSPIHQECVENGITYDEAIRRFVGIHERLKKDPKTTIRQVAALYGVDLDNLDKESNGNGSLPPEVSKRIESLENEVKSTREGSIQMQAQKIAQEIEEFKKTAPFYDQVEQAMVGIVNLCVNTGKPVPPLKTLYDDACWMVPSVREKLIAKERKGEMSDSVVSRKQRVEKAKQASRSIKRRSKESVEKPGDPGSVRDTLSAVWDEAVSLSGAGANK
jgi:hypothetical protein